MKGLALLLLILIGGVLLGQPAECVYCGPRRCMPGQCPTGCVCGKQDISNPWGNCFSSRALPDGVRVLR